MTNDLENPGAQRTRRNIVKAGPIFASAVAVSLATTRNVFAGKRQGQQRQSKATATMRIVS